MDLVGQKNKALILSCNEKWGNLVRNLILWAITQREIVAHGDNIYHHEYSPGDLIISDNLAVGHEASPETQLPRDQVRALHNLPW
jgi:alpha-ketoglutarate-dependent taurine dioxygenase